MIVLAYFWRRGWLLAGEANAPVAARVRRHGDPVAQVLCRHGRERAHHERDVTRPDVELGIGRVAVVRAARPYLCRVSSSGSDSTLVAFSSFRVGGRASAYRPGGASR